MLDFRKEDGTIKTKPLYKYINSHPEDPEVLKIKSFNAGSTIGNYRAYLNSFNSDTVLGATEQEIDYETGVSTSTVVLKFDKPLSEDELLKQHGYDVKEWKLIKHRSSKWNSGTNVLMSSKIEVRPRNILEGSPETLLERIDEALKVKSVEFPKITKKSNSSKKLLVFPISDLHYGLLSDSKTSGNVYNMEIAEERLATYIETTLDNVKIGKDDTILITFGNDFFNCDNVAGTTAHGTPQDNEASYFTVWDRGVALGIKTVDYLLKNTEANIHIAAVQGNHDLQSSHAMSAALYFKYKDNKRVLVKVDSDEKSRFYYNFGENLIGFGHETKIKECHRIMSSECKDWSNYKYRTMFLGHLHKEEVLDTGSLVVRRLPILSGKSTWTDQQGYMSSPRAQAFVFDSEKGLINIVNVEID